MNDDLRKLIADQKEKNEKFRQRLLAGNKDSQEVTPATSSSETVEQYAERAIKKMAQTTADRLRQLAIMQETLAKEVEETQRQLEALRRDNPWLGRLK